MRLARHGDGFVLRDGRHRVAAALAAGLVVIEAEVARSLRAFLARLVAACGIRSTERRPRAAARLGTKLFRKSTSLAPRRSGFDSRRLHRPACGGHHTSMERRGVVLVEGVSDRVALETLAARRGRDLEAEGVSVVSIGGAQAIGRVLRELGPEGAGVRLAGLCDAGEEGEFRRGLERAGLGAQLTRAGMERLGFYVCDADLEQELIRALGAPAVERVVDEQGELRSFRTLQKQPAWQGRTLDEQLRRFMGSGGRRKIRYARLLVEALDLARMPRPLDRVLTHV